MWMRLVPYAIAVFVAVGALAYAYKLGSDAAAHEAMLASKEVELKAEQEYAAALKTALDISEENKRVVEDARLKDDAQAAADRLTIEALQEKVNATPANPDRCLDLDAARRLRSIR